MPASSVPPRVHVLLPRDAPTAVVLRRGPTDHVAVIGWDRREDHFTLGQWFRGRIHPFNCDVSPDGKHWLYMAFNPRKDDETGGSYTVLAKTPYLKALGLWPVDAFWGSGGLFSKTGEYWPYATEAFIEPPDTPRLSPDFIHAEPWCGGVNVRSRLQRDGWTLVYAPERDEEPWVFVFERLVSPTWVLRRHHHLRHAEFTLCSVPQGREVPLPGWEWADLDGDRLVWSERGCLWAADMGPGGLEHTRLLHDFCDMTFRRLQAPY